MGCGAGFNQNGPLMFQPQSSARGINLLNQVTTDSSGPHRLAARLRETEPQPPSCDPAYSQQISGISAHSHVQVLCSQTKRVATQAPNPQTEAKTLCIGTVLSSFAPNVALCGLAPGGWEWWHADHEEAVGTQATKTTIY